MSKEKKAGNSKTGGPKPVGRESELRLQIAEAAYYRAERRGFTVGGELEDWLAAEKEILGAGLEQVSASTNGSS